MHRHPRGNTNTSSSLGPIGRNSVTPVEVPFGSLGLVLQVGEVSPASVVLLTHNRSNCYAFVAEARPIPIMVEGVPKTAAFPTN